MADHADAATRPRRLATLLFGLLLALAGLTFGCIGSAIAASASTSTAFMYAYDRPDSAADARGMDAPATAVSGPGRAHLSRDEQAPVRSAAAARSFDTTISTPAPTAAAVLRGYDVDDKLRAAANASDSTGHLTAPRHAIAPWVRRLVPSSALAAEAGRGALNLPFKSPELRGQVDDVVRHFDEFGAPPAGVAQGGFKGFPQGTYGNKSGALPQREMGYYTESDIWQSGNGVKRGADRLIFGRDGEVWFTPNHYDSFARIR